MDEALAGYYSILGFGLALLIIAVAVVWIFFPFVVMSKLNRQQKTLDDIARSTKQQAEFWNGRNVRIDS